LKDNLGALDFELPAPLAQRLDNVSRPKSQFPYSFFGQEIQGMIHGGTPVGDKPAGYRSEVLINGAGAGVA
jgi:hypothetical protein